MAFTPHTISQHPHPTPPPSKQVKEFCTASKKNWKGSPKHLNSCLIPILKHFYTFAYFFVVLHAFVQFCMLLCSFMCFCVVLHAFAMLCMLLCSFMGFCVVLYAFARLCMLLRSFGHSCVLSVFLQGFACFCLVLCGFAHLWPALST
jgi:hypothetical protein